MASSLFSSVGSGLKSASSTIVPSESATKPLLSFLPESSKNIFLILCFYWSYLPCHPSTTISFVDFFNDLK